jgi:hypothetical protein
MIDAVRPSPPRARRAARRASRSASRWARQPTVFPAAGGVPGAGAEPAGGGVASAAVGAAHDEPVGSNSGSSGTTIAMTM